ARRLPARPAQVAGLAVALALGSVWGGLVLSAMVDLPPSFFIVSLAVLAWLVVLAWTRRRPRSPAPPLVHAPPAPRGGSLGQGCFYGGTHGQAERMDNTQHAARVSDDSEGAQTEESRTPEATAATVARMLANPRRLRRNVTGARDACRVMVTLRSHTGIMPPRSLGKPGDPSSHRATSFGAPRTA